jgi:hypothetical protein
MKYGCQMEIEIWMLNEIKIRMSNEDEKKRKEMQMKMKYKKCIYRGCELNKLTMHKSQC